MNVVYISKIRVVELFGAFVSPIWFQRIHIVHFDDLEY